jgi:hypothetical protein
MIEDINDIILAAKQLRTGTSAYKTTNIDSIDLSRYKFALQRMSQSGDVFIRSSNINKQIMIQDPKQYHRETIDAHKLHYHEFYIDNNSLWTHGNFPKRYNSLMFLSYNMQNYGGLFPTETEFGKYTYLIFPENNCRIAVSPTADFINSFTQYDFADLYEFNSLIRRLYLDIMGHDLRPKSYGEWKGFLTIMQRHFKKKYNANETLESISDLCRALLIGRKQFYDILLNGELIEVIESLMSPSENNFFWVNCDENGLNEIGDHLECWTDGTCLLLRYDIFDRLTRPAKNNLFDKIAAL